MGAINTIAEAIRQETQNDSEFYKKLIYYFELRIPVTMGPFESVRTFVYPLMLLGGYSLEEPFAIETTHTQGGGFYVEENGIVKRHIKLRGTTGFRPRRLKGGGTGALTAMSPEKKSYSRRLQAFVFDKLSGQRHFQYLQDAVFRTYADFKADPATAAETQLIFHNPKDQEHWLVAPEKFSLDRSGRSPLYPYSIDLLVLGPADDLDAEFSEDKSLLDDFKDAARTIRQARDLMEGAANDLTAIKDELTRAIKGIYKILEDCYNLTDAMDEFLDGVNPLIETPYAVISSLINDVETALDVVETTEDANDDIPKIPFRVLEKLAQIIDAADLAGTHPEIYERPVDTKLREYAERMELTLSTSLAERTEAAAADPPGTLAEYDDLGTSMTPGDVESAAADSSVGRGTQRYTGAQEVALGQGDTLANLAAKFLGDARLWSEIAVLNGLQPPFIDDQAGADLGGEETPLPGTLGVGKKILIPNHSKPPQAMPLLPVLGVIPEKSVEEHLLGTDFALEHVSGTLGRELVDWIVDVEGGSVDAKYVRGVANVSQGYKMRLSIEKGTDTMYHKLGLRRTVGLNILPVDLETSRFNLSECIRQDPRTASVRSISFEQQDDAVIADMDVELRGFTRPTNIRTVV